jgi:hypothetical protein
MMSFRFLAAATLSASLAASGAGAQCLIAGLSLAPYGSGCSFAFGVPALSASFDPAACSATVSVNAAGGCCNTFLVSRALAVGLTPVSFPLPFIGAGCDLLTSADLFILEQPSSAGPDFVFDFAPGVWLWGLTVYVQGAAHYFTTIGFTHDYNLTDGLAVTFL